MENVFIENPVIIKDVKQNFEVLERLEAGKVQIKEIQNALAIEIQQEEKKIQEAKEFLNALIGEKEDLQTLITKGNAGLTSKLLENQRKINLQLKEIEEAEERLQETSTLQEEQSKHLEETLYNEFMETGELSKEFIRNAEGLQLKYYSLLYSAFEVTLELYALEKKYKGAVEHAFRNAYPYKGFVDVFPAGGLINQVQNNFPYPNAHRSAWGIDRITKFTEKFDNIEENENFTLYK